MPWHAAAHPHALFLTISTCSLSVPAGLQASSCLQALEPRYAATHGAKAERMRLLGFAARACSMRRSAALTDLLARVLSCAAAQGSAIIINRVCAIPGCTKAAGGHGQSGRRCTILACPACATHGTLHSVLADGCRGSEGRQWPLWSAGKPPNAATWFDFPASQAIAGRVQLAPHDHAPFTGATLNVRLLMPCHRAP